MKTKITFFVICLCSYNFNYAQLAIQWQKCLGGSLGDHANSIQQTLDRGYIVVGWTVSQDGDVGVSYGNMDSWVVKTDSLGTIQWKKVLGASDDDMVNAIQQTSDGGYILAGDTKSNDGGINGSNHGSFDAWIVKLNGSGDIQWQKCFGGTGAEIAYSILQTANGEYVFAGYTMSNDGDVTGNHGAYDFWIVKIDSVGVIQWQKSLGGSSSEIANSIRQTSDGGFIVAGNTVSNDGDVTGYHGLNDCWIVKMDSTGSVQWQKALGGSSNDNVNSVEQTSDNGYILAGYSGSNDGDVTGHHGFGDFWVVKLDSAGFIQWSKCFGGSDIDQAKFVQQTSDGGYIVSGETSSSDGDVSGNHFSTDIWIIKLDDHGVLHWQKCLGGSASEESCSIQETLDGEYILAGTSSSHDGDVLGNHGNGDYWIVKLGSVHNLDLSAIELSLPPFVVLNQAPFSIQGKILNLGSSIVSSLTINYTINGGPVVSADISSLHLIHNAIYQFIHPVSWIPDTVGNYNISIWASNPNGSIDQNILNDHFNFNVTVIDTFVTRNTCMEAFTGTYCGPCYEGNYNLDSVIIPNINHFTVIKYNVWYDQYVTSESNNRAAYYGINAIPTVGLDGAFWGTYGNTTQLTASIFNNYQSVYSFMSIDISNASYSDSTVFVSGTIYPVADYDTGSYFYHIVITEKENDLFPGTNGETVFHNVMIKMSPNDTGMFIPSLTANTPITFNQTIPLPCCTVENMNDLKVVVFVQNNNDKKIQQSAWKDVTTATSVTSIDNKTEEISVYPNPANRIITVITNEEKGELKLYDFLGKEVLQKGVEHEKQITLDISFFPSGIYFLRLNTTKGMYASKIIKE